MCVLSLGCSLPNSFQLHTLAAQSKNFELDHFYLYQAKRLKKNNCLFSISNLADNIPSSKNTAAVGVALETSVTFRR